MLERDPELEALLAPERVTPPEPSKASKERLWQRISETVRSAPASPGRGSALLVAALVGAGLGGWAVWSLSRPAPVPPLEAVVTTTAPLPPAPPVVAPPVVDVGSFSTQAPRAEPVAPRVVDPEGSRRTVREALKANRLAAASSALAAHEAAFPADDVREERAALVVLTHAFAQSSNLPFVVSEFRLSHPNSDLLQELPAQPPPADGGCTLTGRVAFTTEAPGVHADDVLVFLTPERRPPRRDVVREVRVEDGGIGGGVLVVQALDRVKLEEGVHHVVSRSPLFGTRPALPGAYPLRCANHESESGTLYVVPNPKLSTRLAQDGSWTLSGLPPGIVTVTVIEPNGTEVGVRVEACSLVFLEMTLVGKTSGFVEYE